MCKKKNLLKAKTEERRQSEAEKKLNVFLRGKNSELNTKWKIKAQSSSSISGALALLAWQVGREVRKTE